MLDENRTPSEQLLLPRPHMAGLIVAAIVRDMRDKPLRKEECFNYFPASPKANWFKFPKPPPGV